MQKQTKVILLKLKKKLFFFFDLFFESCLELGLGIKFIQINCIYHEKKNELNLA